MKTLQANVALQQECDQLAQWLNQQLVEKIRLTEQIVVQRREVASLAFKVEKLKDQFQHLHQLIKHKAIAAVRQLTSRPNRSNTPNKPSR